MIHRDKLIPIIIFIIIALIVIFTVIFIKNYSENHPCIEYKTYCYYTSTGTGVGPSMSGKGGVAVVVTSNSIYIDCEDREQTPNKVYEEKRCIERK